MPALHLRNCQRMRKNPTEAERTLWDALRGRQINNFAFRRQHPFGPFIVDFYCPSLKLVIEVDGDYHNDPSQQLKDTHRDSHLAHLGLRVLRFHNTQILSDLPSVISAILAFVQS